MNIGDRVRLIHGKEEGVITRIKAGNYIEVDIGDGFSIPVSPGEVVLISPVEAERMKKEVPAGVQSQEVFHAGRQPFAESGIFLSFIAQNDREVHLHLINNTDWKLLFTVFGADSQHSAGLASGILNGKTSQRITSLYLKDFEKWPVFETQILYFSDKRVPAEKVLTHKLRCRIQSFHKQKQQTPLLNQTGHLYQLDGPGAVRHPAISTEKLREEILDKSGSLLPPPLVLPDDTVDLHAEKLPENITGLSNREILELQLRTFEKSLESAIAGGMDQITFVHGVGQGTLRNEIHRRLGKHPNIAYYQDAQKEKFGYGATFVRFK